MADEIIRDDDLSEEELEQSQGGRRTRRANEPLQPAPPVEVQPGIAPTTEAVGEEGQGGGDPRQVL